MPAEINTARDRSSSPSVKADRITREITSVVFRKTPRSWVIGFAIAFLLTMLFLLSVTWLMVKGIGIWGVNIPIAWGFAIANFVWWIGIGHAGTLISAVLFLLHQEWRNAINRFAEAMTLFAVACAGVYPLLHLGRPWLFYWLLPYPNTMRMWPQFRSPLVWDVFAVSTYAIISLLFWYVGLLPDLAAMRQAATRRWQKRIYAFLSLGWTGSSRQWEHHKTLYLIMAGLATPLVVSVHSVVGLDFAAAIVPGWHSTIFPPYFVAGAIYSGFAMVLTLIIPVRAVYKLHGFVTEKHIRNMVRVMLAMGLIVAYGYLMEGFFSWYSHNKFDAFMQKNRLFGPYAPCYWALLICNLAIPQLFWRRGLQTRVVLVWILSIIVNIGMWLERFIIVVTSLHRDFLPSSWGMYIPTRWDWATFAGTLGLFLALMFLFVRVLPLISISEVKHEKLKEVNK